MTPYKDVLPPGRVENLRKLAAHLRVSQSHNFDMSFFAVSADYDQYRDPADVVNVCGSICCAVGHGPSAGIAPLQTDDNWFTYSRRTLLDFDEENDAWSWCFDDLWANRDNTPEGAACRIEYLLDVGLPENWRHQLHYGDPLCYREVSA